MAKLSLSKKKIIGVVIVIVLLAAAVGAGFLMRWLQSKDGGTGQTSPNTLSETVTKTEELLVEGKADEADKHIEESLKNQSLSAEDRYLLYLQQGIIAVSRKDYNAALQSYLAAEQAKSTHIVASKIASLYQLQGNNEKAIEYYKKAISLNNDPKNPVREDENKNYAELIRMLGGQP